MLRRPLRRLVLEVVARVRALAAELAARGALEALLGARMALHLRHGNGLLKQARCGFDSGRPERAWTRPAARPRPRRPSRASRRPCRGRQQHVHVAALLERACSITPSSVEVVEEPLEQHPAALGVGLLAAAEHDRHLDLVAALEEALDVALLGLVVVVGDLRAQLDLADVDLLLVLARGLGLLLLLVLVLRVVEQPGDRRARVRARPRPGRGRAPGPSGAPPWCRSRRSACRPRRSAAPRARRCAR